MMEKEETLDLSKVDWNKYSARNIDPLGKFFVIGNIAIFAYVLFALEPTIVQTMWLLLMFAIMVIFGFYASSYTVMAILNPTTSIKKFNARMFTEQQLQEAFDEIFNKAHEGVLEMNADLIRVNKELRETNHRLNQENKKLLEKLKAQ